jgi:Spy/CpxP family protein refolding chaperone
MTTRRKTILGISAALALGLAASPFLMARGHGQKTFGGHFGHHAGFGKMSQLMKELDLTAEQREALHRIHETTVENNRQVRAALHSGFMDAAQVLVADPRNLQGARAAIAAQQASIDQLKESALGAVSQALAVLTPEQRARLAAHIEEHRRDLTR